MEHTFNKTDETAVSQWSVTPIQTNRWKSDSIGELAKALAKAQGEMEFAKKDSTNPHFKNKYADIAAVIDAVREPLSRNGLSYVQYVESDGQDQYLVTMLMHQSGEWLSSRLRLISMKNDMQGIGGALTYARRYSLSAMVGIAQDDDDGESAGRAEVKSEQKPFVPAGKSIESHPSEAQLKRLFAISKSVNASPEQIRGYLSLEFGKTSSSELTMSEYNKICQDLQSFPSPMFEIEKKEEVTTETKEFLPHNVPWEKYRDGESSHVSK